MSERDLLGCLEMCSGITAFQWQPYREVHYPESQRQSTQMIVTRTRDLEPSKYALDLNMHR